MQKYKKYHKTIRTMRIYQRCQVSFLRCMGIYIQMWYEVSKYLLSRTVSQDTDVVKGFLKCDVKRYSLYFDRENM